MNHEGCAQYFKRLLGHQKCVANVYHFPSRGNALESIANAPFIRGETLRLMIWDFPGGPVAKTLCSQRRGPSSTPGQGPRLHMPQLEPGAANE